jgi:integrase
VEKSAALKIEAKIRTELATSRVLKTSSMDIDKAAGRYFIEHGQFTSSTAIMQTYLKRFVAFFGRAKPLSDITDPEVSRYVASRRASKTAPASINRELAQLRAVMQRARKAWGVAVADVNWSAHRQAEPPGRRRYLSDTEQTALLAAASPILRDIVEFALLTGLRKQNILTLRWSQIDASSKTMTFRQKSKKVGGDHHTLVITSGVQAILDRRRGEHPEFVFTDDGRPLADIKSAWASACKAAGVADMRFHDCRHTAATRILRKTKNLALAKAVLGHRDLNTTLRYAHVLMDDVREGMESLES